MTAHPDSEALAGELQEALSLLEDYHDDSSASNSAEPLPSLLEQCQALCAELPPTEPIRSLHHLACTGGTLLAKCIAAAPNVVLLSEIDPLSTMEKAQPGETPKFAPTDLIHALNHSARPVGNDVLIGAFRAAMDSIAVDMRRRGLHLVIRDHSHSQFCTDIDSAARPTVRDMLADSFPLLSVVSVRHPLDSFLSLAQNGWTHFSPFTLEEYSLRVGQFLARHDGSPIVRYEDFVADPDTTLRKICDLLELPFDPLSTELISAIRISGDSGRKGARISERPRRPVPEQIEQERTSSPYTALCQQLGYDP